MPVARTQPGVCAACHGAVKPEYTFCYRCNEARKVIGELPRVTPITMSIERGQAHQALRGYKDGGPGVRPRFTLQLAGLVAVFLSGHRGCLGEWDYVTTVPSANRDAPYAIVNHIPALRDQHRRVLTAGTSPSGLDVDPDLFTVPRLGGERVLLIDDTFTSGRSVYSATGALRAAGASVVGPLVIGRHVNPSWPDSQVLLEWLADQPWDEANCVHCNGARPAEPKGLFDF